MEYRIYGEDKVYVYELDKDPRIAFLQLSEITDSIVESYVSIYGAYAEELIEDIRINTDMTCTELYEGEQNNSEVVPYDNTDNIFNDN